MSETKKSIKIDLNSVELPNETETDNLSPPASLDEEKKGRFYLPVLNLNNKDMWKPLPLEEREHWTDEKAYNTCIGNCCGVEGLKAGCCYLDFNDLEHVLGPVDDTDIKLILDNMRKKGINLSREDVVIDYEEGKIIGNNFFNNHPVFQKKESYPFLRFQVTGPRFVCKFLSTRTGKCTIYDFRPNMCRTYLCQFVATQFVVRKKSFMLNPKNGANTFIKIR